MRLELPERRLRRRLKMRFTHVVKEDMRSVSVKEEDAEERVRWRQMIQPLKETAERTRKRGDITFTW